MTVNFRSRSPWNRTIAQCCWPLWPVASNYLSKWMRSCEMHRTLTRWRVLKGRDGSGSVLGV